MMNVKFDHYDWTDGGARLRLWVACKLLPDHIEKYGQYSFMNNVVDKVNEQDDIVVLKKGTRKSTNRGIRRKSTFRSKRHLNEIAKIQKAHEFKYMNDSAYDFFYKTNPNKKERNKGKAICFNYEKEM